jgi:dihydroflavonol-4-reductase
MVQKEKQTVLVTGASGFIAGHCILRLLKEGYAVRGSLRTPGRADEVRMALAPHVSIDDLSFVTLDLSSDDGWEEVLQGCTYLLHVASPFPNANPDHEDDLIIPARDGAVRALSAAAKAGVKRTVMTSSIAAIAYGENRGADYVYSEEDWSNTQGGISAYAKSKTIAERAAWDFMETKQAGKMELAVINPGAVLGPLLGSDYSTSGDMVKKLLDGSTPACPAIGFPCIDVRDVADAHYEAMLRPTAAGRRYALVGPYAWMIDVSRILHGAGYKSPTKTFPNFMVHIIGIFDKTVRSIKSGLGVRRDISNERLRTELGIEPRSLDEMVLSMAESMVKFDVVQPKMLY